MGLRPLPPQGSASTSFATFAKNDVVEYTKYNDLHSIKNFAKKNLPETTKEKIELGEAKKSFTRKTLLTRPRESTDGRLHAEPDRSSSCGCQERRAFCGEKDLHLLSQFRWTQSLF